VYVVRIARSRFGPEPRGDGRRHWDALGGGLPGARNARGGHGGSAFGLLTTVQAGGNLIASAAAELSLSAVSPSAAFVFLVAAMVIAAALIATAGRASAPEGHGH
jgi:hypothetical protein